MLRFFKTISFERQNLRKTVTIVTYLHESTNQIIEEMQFSFVFEDYAQVYITEN